MPLTITSDGYVETDIFQLSENSFPDQGAPTITALANGTFVAVWPDLDGFNEPGIRARIFNGDGRPVGAEFWVPASTPPYQVQPSATALADGSFVVTWSEESPYPAGFDIKAQIFSVDGQKIGSEFLVNSSIDGFQTSAKLVGLSGGGFAVIWEQALDAGYDHIRGQIFASDGTRVGVEFVVNDDRPTDKMQTSITALADGRFVASWFDQEYHGEFGVQAQIFNADGSKAGAQFSVNDYVPGRQSYGELVALPDGGFAGAWFDSGTAASRQGLWVQLFDEQGHRAGAAQRVAAAAGTSMALEYVPGKGVLVAWTTLETDKIVIHGQFVEASGADSGDGFILGTTEAGGKWGLDVTVLANGELILAWQSEGVTAQILFPATYGSDGADHFSGTDNRDFYVGLGGNDIMDGGGEDDGLAGGAGDDVIHGGAGNDMLEGGSGNDMLYGDAGDDRLEGGDGQDRLDGGSGADSMAGQAGNDSYVVDDIADTVIEKAGEGFDTVDTNIDYVLADHVESLRLIGVTGAIDAYGNAGNNWLNAAWVTVAPAAGTQIRLFGEGGSDHLLGSRYGDYLDGGTGADSMTGGDGNDTYVVDAVSDQVIERANGGFDTVNSSISYRLTDNVESLRLIGVTGAVDAHGNAGNNWLNAAWVTVAPAEGTQIRLFGEGGNDHLLGSRYADYLDGGTGADSMTGGDGNDTYVVDDAGDLVIEQAGGGFDTVNTRMSYTLPDNVESLRLLDGTGVVEGRGNASDNWLNALWIEKQPWDPALEVRLYGGDGNDHLLGWEYGSFLDGGAGNDVLQGARGADRFHFGDALDARTNVDTIVDFWTNARGGHISDRIELDDAIFTTLSTGALSADAFVANADGVATTAGQRIIYDTDSGALFYDADGSGAGEAVQFAVFVPHPAAGNPALPIMTAAEFVVV